MNKRKYSKPGILFEDFSLSTNIAAGCEWEANEDGGVNYHRYTIFVEGVTGCKKVVVEGDPYYDGLCYHNPMDYNVFNS